MVFKSTLSPELLEQAKKELHEDPDRIDADIEHIRTWIKKQPHITARTDDMTILRYLRGCKFSLERTKEKIDTYYTCKTMAPEWFSNRDPQDKNIRDILQKGLLLPLPGTNSKGESVVLSRFHDYDPHKIDLNTYMKSNFIIFETFLEENESHTVTGVVTFCDVGEMTTGHALQFTPPVTKKIMVIWQDAYAMRPKGLHFINTPSIFESMLSVIKGFMKEKMRKRIYIHGKNMDNLHKAVGKEVLPVEYGGTNGNIQDIIDYWIKKIDERRDWFLEDAKYRVDESKRPGKPKTTTDLFGLDGSFRKLNVD